MQHGALSTYDRLLAQLAREGHQIMVVAAPKNQENAPERDAEHVLSTYDWPLAQQMREVHQIMVVVAPRNQENEYLSVMQQQRIKEMHLSVTQHQKIKKMRPSVIV